MATRVGTKGQVVIEKEIRDELGIEPGWTAIQQVVDGHVEIYFIPPEHNDSLFGVLAQYTDVRIPDEDAFRAAREQAWDERAAEIVARMRETSCE
jgi:AbrB family looped-hinge helix DNA binding protein